MSHILLLMALDQAQAQAQAQLECSSRDHLHHRGRGLSRDLDLEDHQGAGRVTRATSEEITQRQLTCTTAALTIITMTTPAPPSLGPVWLRFAAVASWKSVALSSDQCSLVFCRKISYLGRIRMMLGYSFLYILYTLYHHHFVRGDKSLVTHQILYKCVTNQLL